MRITPVKGNSEHYTGIPERPGPGVYFTLFHQCEEIQLMGKAQPPPPHLSVAE
jgi:hypothetical protein